jgi:hypothetical protein
LPLVERPPVVLKGFDQPQRAAAVDWRRFPR